jgi:hypothetical protein
MEATRVDSASTDSPRKSPISQRFEEVFSEQEDDYDQYRELSKLSSIGDSEEGSPNYNWSWNRSLTLQIDE